jgi:hypothetical protein
LHSRTQTCPVSSLFLPSTSPTTHAAVIPAHPQPPVAPKEPSGVAASPAHPRTRPTASASTPTLPPWAWRSARDPRRRYSTARDHSSTFSALLHSAPSYRCARVHPDHQCLASFMDPDHTRAPRPRHPALRPGPRSLLSNPGHVPMVTLCPAHGPDPDAPKRPPFDHLVTSPRIKPAHSGPGPVPDAHGHVPTSMARPRATCLTRTHPISAAHLRPAGPPGSSPTEHALSALKSQ